MYTIILFSVIGTVFGFIQRRRRNWDRENILLSACGGIVVGFLIAMFVGLFCVPDVAVKYGPHKLVAMRSTDSISGSFVWGSGGVNGQVFYNFLLRNEDGSLTPGQVAADSSVHIVEDPNLSKIGYWSAVYDEPDRSSYLVGWATCYNRSTLVSNNFRVPSHTVVQTFTVK